MLIYTAQELSLQDTAVVYNYYDAAPGTGAYHQVAAGSTYSVGSDDGIWRVELPKGVFNLFVYNGNWSSVTMCQILQHLN